MEPVESHSVAPTAEMLQEMDVDDLLKYINGKDADKSQAKMTTRKAAKRARQKQRKVSTTVMSCW